MSRAVDHTTLLCLFHHEEQAQAALRELQEASVPQDLISVLGGEGGVEPDEKAVLAGLGVPRRDLEHLQEGLDAGGKIVIVKALTSHVEDVERIFARHQAEKIDEAETAEAEVSPLAAEVTGASAAGLAASPLLHREYDDRGVAEPAADTFVGEDEGEEIPLAGTGYSGAPGETVLLVSESDVMSGEADVALEALEEESLLPVEVVVIPDAPRGPVRPMEPASRYRQVD